MPQSLIRRMVVTISHTASNSPVYQFYLMPLPHFVNISTHCVSARFGGGVGRVVSTMIRVWGNSASCPVQCHKLRFFSHHRVAYDYPPAAQNTIINTCLCHNGLRPPIWPYRQRSLPAPLENVKKNK